MDVLIKCDLFLIITDIIWPQRDSLTLPLHSQMNTHWFTRSGQIISLMFESRCSHLKYRYFTCPNQEVPRLISSYSLYISSKKLHTWSGDFCSYQMLQKSMLGKNLLKCFHMFSRFWVFVLYSIVWINHWASPPPVLACTVASFTLI